MPSSYQSKQLLQGFAAALLASLSSVAMAQDSQPSSQPIVTPPADPPTLTPEEPAVSASQSDSGGPPQTGFQIQARMSTQLGLASLITPGFSFGYRTGKIVVSAEVGVTAGQATLKDPLNGDDAESFSLVHVMPSVSFDVWQSADGRARLNLIGGVGFGKGTVTSESSFDDDGDPATPLVTNTVVDSATFLPTLVGVGGDYYLHKNFAIGVEAGAQLPILLNSKEDFDGTVEELDLNAGIQSLHGMIRLTFIAGK